MLRMIPVESSHIRAIGYDFDAQRLHVEYKTDRTYTWDGVPPEKFAGLMAAESHGKYLNGARLRGSRSRAGCSHTR
jgi:hypothetical protein